MALWRILLCLVLAAGSAVAETRALLIGVATYDPALGMPDLQGPPNDVRLLRDTLAGLDVTDIRLLADGVQGRPTHAAILAGFADLARDAAAGDVVFVSLSGHGTRQPDQNGDETDGLDEVFLPADTGRAAAGSPSFPMLWSMTRSGRRFWPSGKRARMSCW